MLKYNAPWCSLMLQADFSQVVEVCQKVLEQGQAPEKHLRVTSVEILVGNVGTWIPWGCKACRTFRSWMHMLSPEMSWVTRFKHKVLSLWKLYIICCTLVEVSWNACGCFHGLVGVPGRCLSACTLEYSLIQLALSTNWCINSQPCDIVLQVANP